MKAVIFDMDGTLIHSEPIWKEAEKMVFTNIGVDVTSELSAKTASMTTREVTEFWYGLFPWQGKSLDEVEQEVVDRVAEIIAKEGVPMFGVMEVLKFFKERDFKIGLATNAPAVVIPVVLDKLNISHYFDAASSSEDEINGKPDPAVYLSTAKKLKVEPAQCIAFEDSVSGITAAIRANMKTVAVPPSFDFSDKKYDISNLKIRTLLAFSDSHLKRLDNCL